MRPMYEVERLVPAGIGNIWAATIVVRIEDRIEEITVTHTVRTTVRLSHTVGEPTESMLQRAHDQVRSILAGASAVLEANSFSDLQELLGSNADLQD